ncbi:hypothetical protein B0T18DRAFT_125659 [Schizothecium vesticola]|uniref:Uncharacterized protein n=1 Tax=Schizothecium vesticola TaxID=314040 RepID=A0AA40F362_9PEZI|nr:hypothetical protein B0T18DRAFT_125659 [Schizothecium vesticola]
MGTRARVRAHCPEVAVSRTLDRCYPLKESGRLPWMVLRWAVLEVVLLVRLDGCYLALVESMQRCESSSAWHPHPGGVRSSGPGRLSLCCRCRVDGWVQRQGSDARQASGTSTALAEWAARAGGGGGRFPEAPWTPCSQGSRRSVWLALGRFLLARTLASGPTARLGGAWRAFAVGVGGAREELLGCAYAWHLSHLSPSFNCIDAAAQSVVSSHRRTRRHGSISARQTSSGRGHGADSSRLDTSFHGCLAGLLSIFRHCPSAKPRDGRVGLRGGCPPPVRVTSRRLGALASARPPVGLRDTAVSCLLRLRHVTPWRYRGMAARLHQDSSLVCEPASLPDSCETVWDAGQRGRPPPTPDRPLLSTMEYTSSHAP